MSEGDLIYIQSVVISGLTVVFQGLVFSMKDYGYFMKCTKYTMRLYCLILFQSLNRISMLDRKRYTI